MIKIENDCVGCQIYCVHCGLSRTEHYYCDECDIEFDPSELYDVDGSMLCAECILGQYRTIE